MTNVPQLRMVSLLALMGLLLLLACTPSSGGGEAQFHCPMHPTVVSDKASDCPICGMRLVPIPREKASPVAETYICPMHPEVTTQGPSDCPICGMHLVPKKVEGSVGQPSSVPGLATISPTEEQRKQMALATSPVEVRPLAREVRTSARIVPDETRQHRVTTKVEGWVEKLFVNATGQEVRRGQPLLTLYSPELLATQEEYLSALAASKRLSGSTLPGVAQGGDDLLRAARRRLELWDLSEKQIQALEASGKAQRVVTLYSPASGFVSEKMVLEGQKIMPGEPLLTVSDLSTVWAEADVYEADLGLVRVGMDATLSLRAYPGKGFPGKIAFLSPFLDPMARTLKARLEVPNPDRTLKPEMYGEMSLSLEKESALTVPTSAVMRTGQKSVVFVQADSGALTPTAVTLGARSGDYYEVLSGLSEGERVVTSANFLVDSESSLKAALQAVAGH